MNHLKSIIQVGGIFVTSYYGGYYLSKWLQTEHKEYGSGGKILLKRCSGNDQCSLHILKKESCSKECRYEFLIWLLSCIDEAKTRIDVCMYLFTQDSIADALIRAKQRGVRVRLILTHVENDNEGMGATVLKLRRSYIPIRTMKTTASQLMHLKMILVDHEYVIYGSFNFTKSALESNSEEMMKLSSPSLVSDWATYIQGVWDEMTDHRDFMIRVRNLAEKTLKTRAMKKAQNVPIDDLGKW